LRAGIDDPYRFHLFVFLYINTPMIQRVLTEPDWTQRMLPDDLRALTPFIYTHLTPYGIFRLDMNQRLVIEEDAIAA
jgi:Tn3 transposase DDE domain